MKLKKVLGISSALSLATAGIATSVMPANAAIFNTGDKISVNIIAQVTNLVGVGGTLSPTVTFLPPVGGGVADMGVAGIGNTSLDAAGFASCNSLSLVSTDCDPAFVRSFTATAPANDPAIAGLTDADFFMKIVNAETASTWRFSLLTGSIFNPQNPSSVFTPLTPACVALLTAGCEVNVDFEAFGFVQDEETGETTKVKYAYSQPRLLLVSGSGTDADPFVTDILTSAANITVEAVAVPESSAANSLLAFGAVGTLGLLGRKIRKA